MCPFCFKEEKIMWGVFSFIHKGYKVTYVKTNYGSLFVARTLIALLKKNAQSFWDVKKFVSPGLYIKLNQEGPKAPVCVGLQGAKQIFADCFDYELFDKLKQCNIWTGELPCADDIKIVERFLRKRGKSYCNSEQCQENLQIPSIRLELDDIKKQVKNLISENEQLKKKMSDIEQQTRIHQALYGF